MSTVTINPVDIGTPVQVSIRNGIYDDLRFSVLVTGLSNTDNSILTEALTDAATAYPALNPGAQSANWPQLFCDEINARSIGPGQVLIDYTYRRASFYYLGEGYHDNGTNFGWSGGTSVTQYETPYDWYGNIIQVAHTWDGTELEPGAIDRQEITAKSISVLAPASTAITRGFLQAAYPDLIARSWAGYVNADIWAGEAPGAWLCTSVNWQPANTNLNPVLFEFEFTFELKFGGWQPVVWFENPRTGLPPYNIVNNVGVKEVTWYPSRPFWSFFPIG